MSNKATIEELRKSGHTVKEISRLTGLSKATCSKYSRNIQITDIDEYNRRVSTNIRVNALKNSRANHDKWHSKFASVRESAVLEWDKLSADPNFHAFVALYLGEGFKRCGKKSTPLVGIANSDQSVIRFMKAWFDKLWHPSYSVYVYYGPTQDENEIRKFWEGILPTEHIRTKMIGSGKKGKIAYNGTCYLRFSNWVAFHTIIAWIDCWRSTIL